MLVRNLQSTAQIAQIVISFDFTVLGNFPTFCFLYLPVMSHYSCETVSVADEHIVVNASIEELSSAHITEVASLSHY